MTRQTAVLLFVVLGATALAAPTSAAPPRPSSASHPARAVNEPTLAVVPRPDLDLTELRLEQVKTYGKMPNGQPCWIFNLYSTFYNTGKVKSGPFKVVWERADAMNGPYMIELTAEIANAAPGVPMTPGMRQFNNCQGMKWWRVRLDADNVVKESKEDNNSRVIRF